MAEEKMEEMNTVLSQEETDNTELIEETEPVEKEIVLSPETIEEIGEPDKNLMLKKVAKGYEEAKRKRENYKKIGPLVVLITGVIFLTLMFTLDNKIIFLSLWVISVLYIATLMIRAEYKYHNFKYYLGIEIENPDDELADEESEDTDDQAVSEDNSETAERNYSLPDETDIDETQKTEPEEQA